MKLIAHRGASDEAPENTLAAMQLAWQNNADGVEIDVRLTKDQEVVLLHDPILRRTTGNTSSIADLTLEEVQTLDAGSWKDSRWRGEKIPRLYDVLEQMPKGKVIFVEIKCGAEIVPKLKQVLAAFPQRQQDVFMLGFNPLTMDVAKKNLSDHAVYLNVEPSDQVGPVPLHPVEELIAFAQSYAFDGLSLGYDTTIIPPVARKMKNAGFKLAAWTVDDAVTARRVQGMGFDFLLTNHSSLLRPVVRA